MNILLRAYGAFFMAPDLSVSLLLLLSTLVMPLTGLAGLAAGGLAMGWRRLLGLSPVGFNLDVINSVLVGLLLGATFAPSLAALTLLVGGALLTVAATHLLAEGARLPLLCAPFVLVSWFLLAAGKSLWLPLVPALPAGTGYLNALGVIYFNPTPLGGILMLLALTRASGYLPFMAACGFAASEAILWVLGVPPGTASHLWAGSEAALTALMIGGLFTAPSLRSCAVATGAAALASLFYLGLAQLFWPLGLYPLALPFLISTWTTMRLLNPSRSPVWRDFWLATPSLPHLSAEASEVGRSRGLINGSLALRAPFQGRWEVYQGWDGPHTHQGPWRYGVDFFQTHGGRSFVGAGDRLEDYFCYAAPLLSPTCGVVVACRGDLPDNRPGAVNLEERWGNYVLIAVASGEYVLLAHLQQASLGVELGQRVLPGQFLGRCGNSGRSPQPHLHLHVQAALHLGSPTHPFHLTQLFCDGAFQFNCQPRCGNRLTASQVNPALSQALRLPVGTRLTYAVEGGEQVEFEVKLDLAGQFWLHSSSGACAAFLQSEELLAFWGRQGPADPVLDAFLLALGLTPKVDGTLSYQDAPPARLLPAASLPRTLSRLRPWSRCCRTSYVRYWEPSSQLWVQQGVHRVRNFLVVSEVRLSESTPPPSFEIREDDQVRLRARLVAQGGRADVGIPPWQSAVA